MDPSPSPETKRTMSGPNEQRARKLLTYDHGEETTTVQVLELLDPDFGLYVWPSALVLAEYVSHRLDMFRGTQGHPKTILELGAGTALPSLLLSKVCRASPSFIIVTDRQDPRVLANIREAVKENGIHTFYPDDPGSWVMVRGLNWGDFSLSSMHNKDGGLLQLLEEVSKIEQIKKAGNPGHIDLILGSDVFYNPSDFEPLLATVSYIINRHNPNCVFLTTYQNRSSKRNIDHLLEKWDLEGQVIDWETFGFNMSKFIIANEDDDEHRADMNMDEDQPILEQEGTKVHSPAADDERQHMMQVKNTTNNLTAGTLGNRNKVPLVDYSSGSGSEDEMDAHNGDIPEKDRHSLVEQATGRSSYRLGDGGALSSVYLFCISKRGCGYKLGQR